MNDLQTVKDNQVESHDTDGIDPTNFAKKEDFGILVAL